MLNLGPLWLQLPCTSAALSWSSSLGHSLLVALVSSLPPPTRGVLVSPSLLPQMYDLLIYRLSLNGISRSHPSILHASYDMMIDSNTYIFGLPSPFLARAPETLVNS